MTTEEQQDRTEETVSRHPDLLDTLHGDIWEEADVYFELSGSVITETGPVIDSHANHGDASKEEERSKYPRRVGGPGSQSPPPPLSSSFFFCFSHQTPYTPHFKYYQLQHTERRKREKPREEVEDGMKGKKKKRRRRQGGREGALKGEMISWTGDSGASEGKEKLPQWNSMTCWRGLSPFSKSFRGSERKMDEEDPGIRPISMIKILENRRPGDKWFEVMMSVLDLGCCASADWWCAEWLWAH
ncbi:hypothetical protein EYF80_005184 [Liparis tanakae]|uniref:Uncharacterized protein n=1 Tax=Liparis tanakae TaxID=230148 RepID=A0A4Z2J3N4_9TELE|nr:hypothetical protein EYF80_005184 [Liparis tanakae]